MACPHCQEDHCPRGYRIDPNTRRMVDDWTIGTLFLQIAGAHYPYRQEEGLPVEWELDLCTDCVNELAARIGALVDAYRKPKGECSPDPQD